MRRSDTATPSTKRGRPEDSPGAASSPGSNMSDILDSIDKKLSSLDCHLNLLEILHKEFQGLRESLEFSQQQVQELTEENQALRETVKILGNNTAHLSKEGNRQCPRPVGCLGPVEA